MRRMPNCLKLLVYIFMSLLRVSRLFVFTSRKYQTSIFCSTPFMEGKKNYVFNKNDTNIKLTSNENGLFRTLIEMNNEKNLGTTIRVAGGWVRDKLLRLPEKNDIDFALDNITGGTFAKNLHTWTTKRGMGPAHYAIVKQNVEKSKHLETAAVTFGEMKLDFVNLRTESYCSNSRIPLMKKGTPKDDAERRDFTINSLFYNLHTSQVEDYTGMGLLDLQNRIIRTPLSALVTLKDDPLRALRCVRFACRFGFSICDELAMALKNTEVHLELASKVSKERVVVELVQMFRSEASLNAVLMLYKFNLINNILAVPESFPLVPTSTRSRNANHCSDDNINKDIIAEYEKVVTPKLSFGVNVDNNKVSTEADRVCIVTGSKLIRKHMKDKKYNETGLATFLIAHYFTSKYRHHSEIDNNNNNNNSNTNCCSTTHDNNNSTRIESSGELWKNFVLTTLLAGTEGISAKKSEYSAIPLIEFILKEQLKLSTKDIQTMSSILHGAGEFRRIIAKQLQQQGWLLHNSNNTVMRSNSSNNNNTSNNSSSSSNNTSLMRQFDSSKTSISSAKDNASTVLNNECILPHSSYQLQLEAAGLELGLAMRNTGQYYLYALQLASAQLILQTILAKMQSMITADDNCDALSVIIADFTILNNESSRTVTAIPAERLFLYTNTLQSISTAMSSIIYTMNDLQLHNKWNAPPVFSGNIIKEHLKNIPPGNEFTKIMESQIEWKLKYPQGTDCDLLNYIKEKYKHML